MSDTVLRTPDEAFPSLPGFPYAPQYVAIQSYRMAYIDEGDARGSVFLCLHGQPTWSYLYRKMIPIFAAAGGRVVAPDLIGFGRSDKPVDEATYTFDFHRDALLAFVRTLDLRDVTLVVQDWGGLLGLTLPPAMPERFARVLLMNTALGTGDRPLGAGFEAWRAYSNAHPDLDIAKLMHVSVPELTAEEAAAYAAPCPDARYKAGVRRFPNLVPDDPGAGGAAISRDARTFWRERWDGASFMAIGMRDPVITPAAMHALHATIRNCPPPLELADAGHFVQERGDAVARAALASFAGP